MNASVILCARNESLILIVVLITPNHIKVCLASIPRRIKELKTVAIAKLRLQITTVFTKNLRVTLSIFSNLRRCLETRNTSTQISMK
ncbi:hypothetical protein BKA69DRAFT_1064302 [Paraphysoderma sedebokerense]|nr:hypothetical protein BKA69DRAFT_1064302 [Paraphysoderma sedebokerense]